MKLEELEFKPEDFRPILDWSDKNFAKRSNEVFRERVCALFQIEPEDLPRVELKFYLMPKRPQ